MTFLEKLDWLMNREGLNKHTLAQKCGVPYTTIVGLYDRGAENARLSTVNRLCAFFGVPLDYLVLDEYDKPEDFSPNGKTVEMSLESADEVELITMYRSLSVTARATVLSTVRGFVGNPDMLEKRQSSATA